MIEDSIIKAIIALGDFQDRVRPIIAQNDALPYCVVKAYNSDHEKTHGGETNLTRTGVQIEVYFAGPEAYSKSRRAARKIQRLLNGYRGNLHNTEVYYASCVVMMSGVDPITDSDKWTSAAFIDCEILHDEE